MDHRATPWKRCLALLALLLLGGHGSSIRVQAQDGDFLRFLLERARTRGGKTADLMAQLRESGFLQTVAEEWSQEQRDNVMELTRVARAVESFLPVRVGGIRSLERRVGYWAVTVLPVSELSNQGRFEKIQLYIIPARGYFVTRVEPGR